MAIAAVKELVDLALIRKETHRNDRGDAATNTYRLTPRLEWKGGGGSDNALPSDNALGSDNAPEGSDNALGSDNAPKGTPFKGTPSEGAPLEGWGGRVTKTPARPAKPPSPPAVAIYEEIFERKANSNQRKAIAETVTNCQHWRDVLTTWALKGHSPTNVIDQLDVYANGWQRKGTNGHAPPAPEPKATRRMTQPIFAKEQP